VGSIESFPQNDLHILLPSQIENFELSVLIAAQVKGFDKQARLTHFRRDKIIPHADRYSLFAAAVTDEAVKQSGLEVPLTAPYRRACIIGSAFGGIIMNLEVAYPHIFELKQVSSHPLTLVRFIGSSAAAHVGIGFGVKGPTFATCGTCSTAT
jgi:nodulation protein E